MNAQLFQQASQALSQIKTFKHPADVSLSYFFRNNPQLGQQDRNWIAETVFGLLRNKIWIDWRIGPSSGRQQLIAYFRLVKGLPQKELATILREEDIEWLKKAMEQTPAEMPISAQAELPEWVCSRLKAHMQDADIIQIGRGMKESAPLDLRINTFKAQRAIIEAQLQKSGLEYSATPFSPFGLRLKGKPAIHKHPAFVHGDVEVQDEGSQILGLLVAPKRQEMVVDFCAGAGGKTLLLGAMMASQGRLYAFDVAEKRINNLKPRLKRSGLSNVHPQLITSENDQRIKRLAGKIDRVLVDAPCSGLGTLRRNPDLKWRQNEVGLAEILQKQKAILQSAARLVKPGGRLVYATCSILPEENEDQITAFLEKNPDFEITSAKEVLEQQRVELDTGDFLKLYPHQHSTDGFFAAILTRKAS
ncbi:RsmB/NOP family class I SAM-dependent RNA methyltransferase [Leeia sp. TBRC 13508]|uniref:RsmB/NOP family class I SAM-dependent RNA methyltransferase n=1 Tax=Leeia speluncae TaxID=2884804 RepID=A0ABS8D2W6_9NEIS|nr:RsmB/NOP family class I SAM-dependent RNA methyltransferase [Leeia speluncae]MCB6182543.1 RsmB/NOP family class I SAM-dependent RNA methyltransferase [Leeia speluncae]